MTTAHRPTFEPARGGSGRNEGDLSKLSQQYSSKDMPSHTKLKYRRRGHMTETKSRNLQRELEEKERQVSRGKRRSDSAWNTSGTNAKKAHIEHSTVNAQDEDEPYDDIAENSDDDEDVTAELMMELAKVKKERAVEKAQRDAAAAEQRERIRNENILHGNPLLNQEASDFKVKRRWDDDVVFKNCAKGIEERKKESHFINDAIRSEFHKKFMDKYIK